MYVKTASRSKEMAAGNTFKNWAKRLLKCVSNIFGLSTFYMKGATKAVFYTTKSLKSWSR
jgi:hypothetical protein